VLKDIAKDFFICFSNGSALRCAAAKGYPLIFPALASGWQAIFPDSSPI
jgi:hypothetical protein